MPDITITVTDAEYAALDTNGKAREIMMTPEQIVGAWVSSALQPVVAEQTVRDAVELRDLVERTPELKTIVDTYRTPMPKETLR